MYDAYIIGALALDLHGRFKKYPKEGKEVFTSELSFAIGGTAYNISIGFIQNGIKPVISAAIGHDIPGKMIEQKLKELGIESVLIKTKETGTTTVFSILTPEDRTMLTYKGAEEFFKLTEEMTETAKKAKITCISSYIFLGKDSLQQIKRFLKDIKPHTSIVLSIAESVLKSRYHQIVEVFKYTDILFFNDKEYSLVAGNIPENQEVVITQKEKGAIYIHKDTFISVPQKEKVKGGRFTGAGDAFCGGFLSGRLNGLSPEECLSLGNKTALSWILQR